MLRRLASTAARAALAAEARASAPLLSSLNAFEGASACRCHRCSSSNSSTSSSFCFPSPPPATFSSLSPRPTPSSTPSTPPRTFSSLPVIDVDALLSESSTREQRLVAAKKLHEACRDVGFFYARARGTTDSAASRELLSRARRWFEETPLEEKRKIALSAATGFRGWQPLHANVTRFEEQGEGKENERRAGYVGDHHEAIDLYKGVTAADGLPASPVHAPPGTGFPAESDPELSRALERHIARCLALGEAIMRGLALGLGLGDERFFERPENGGTTAKSSYWVSRVIFYPPLVLEEEKKGDIPRSERLSCGEHTDYGWLTMITATSSGDRASENALQVRNARGEWVSAPPLEDAFVCNVGDFLKIASGGVYSSTPHRVVHAAVREKGEGKRRGGGGDEKGQEDDFSLPPPRTSIAVFYEPHFNALVGPVVGGEAGETEAKKRYGAHLEAKVLSNFEGV